MRGVTRNFLAGIALATSAFAAQANALVFDSDGYATFMKEYPSTTTSFSDVYTFTIPSLSDVGGNVTSSAVRLKNFFTKDLDLSAFYITGTSGTYSGVRESYGSFDQWSIEAMNLASGDYSLTVAGNVLGTGGKYEGQLLMMPVSPVPEPATWIMTLGGLGLVGMIARRRKGGSNKTYTPRIAAAV